MDLPILPPPRVATARERFLRHEPVPAGVVRQPILASWDRSRSLSVEPGHLELPSTTASAKMPIDLTSLIPSQPADASGSDQRDVPIAQVTRCTFHAQRKMAARKSIQTTHGYWTRLHILD